MDGLNTSTPQNTFNSQTPGTWELVESDEQFTSDVRLLTPECQFNTAHQFPLKPRLLLVSSLFNLQSSNISALAFLTYS